MRSEWNTGVGEWDAEKHGRLRRQWRKLHLAVDAGTGEIEAHLLTKDHAADAPSVDIPSAVPADGTFAHSAQVPALLGQAKGVIASVTADGAYDGEPTYAAPAARQRHPSPDVVVPPRAPAVPSSNNNDGDAQSQRDRHIQLMAERGRIGKAAKGSVRAAHGMAAEGGKRRPGTPGGTKPKRQWRDTNT